MGKDHPRPVKEDALSCDDEGEDVGAFIERRFIKITTCPVPAGHWNRWTYIHLAQL